MVDIVHRVGVEAPVSRVFHALSTKSGLAGWWTEQVTGDERVNGILNFRFGDLGGNDMKVIELVPNLCVGWECTGGATEWIGTNITFNLKETDGETVVLFIHYGWREQVEFMHACSTKWAMFLMGMKAFIETGRGTPYPHDVQVSRWF